MTEPGSEGDFPEEPADGWEEPADGWQRPTDGWERPVNGWHEPNGDAPHPFDDWAEPGEDWGGSDEHRWPLVWHGLYARERWMWFEQLWCDACKLHDRYHLALRSGWWADQIQVEALAALASWVARYDSGEWDDPPGKLALLYDLERVGSLLRDGREPFRPDRDRAAFVSHLLELGGRPPPA